MNQTTTDIIEWIKLLPKTEIHLHVEAVVYFKTYMALNSKYNIDSSLHTIDDYKKQLDFNNLTDMIKYFLYLQTFFRKEEDFLLMADDLLNYALNNNIYYLEIFFSPSKLIELGHVNFFAVLDLLSDSFNKMKNEHNIDVKMLIDVSRSFGPKNAMNNLSLLLQYVKKHPENRILGIGLGGAEKGNHCADYKKVFDRARKNNFHVVAHAGEEVGAQSIWDSLNVLKAERIGHGTSAIFDNELIAYLIEKKVPLEICPTSNIMTKKYVKDMHQHPLRKFFDVGMNVTLNTDDPLLFNISLNKEYYKLHKFLNFTKEEIIQVAKNGLYSTFLSDEEKDRHWQRVEQVLAAGANK